MEYSIPSNRKQLLTGLLAIYAVFSMTTHATLAEDSSMHFESTYSFADTIDNIESALKDKSMTVFAVIDHRAAAQSVGLDMPPTTVLIYGNPKAGTPLMVAAPDFALELPLRVLIREDSQGKVHVTLNSAASLEGKHNLPAGMAETLMPAEKLIEAAVKGGTGQYKGSK